MFSVFYVVQYGNHTRSSQKGSIWIVDCKLATYEWFFIIVYEIKLSKITFPVETRLAWDNKMKIKSGMRSQPQPTN